MTEVLVIIGSILGVIISIATISRLIFYTKSEINTKIEEVHKNTETKAETLKQYIVNESNLFRQQIENNKDRTFEKMVEAERENNKARQEIYNTLSQNKQLFENYNKDVLEMISQIRQENKDMCNNYIHLLNGVKDELKNDYINRCNELLQIINTKVNVSDFDRLEQKFDKVTQTITELKTIVQLQLDNREEK